MNWVGVELAMGSCSSINGRARSSPYSGAVDFHNLQTQVASGLDDSPWRLMHISNAVSV